MPLAVARKRGPPAPLPLQQQKIASIVAENDPVPPQEPKVIASARRATRNPKRLSLNVSSANSSQDPSPSSPTAPAPLPLRRPSVASLPGPTATALLHRADEGAPASAPYVNGPVLIMPGVWLGSEDNARDWPSLLQHGIRFILNVAKEVGSPFETSQQHPVRPSVSSPNLQLAHHIDLDPQPSRPLHGPSSMRYLKLSWSHGQSDLVQKGFVEGMRFVDDALSRNEGVLIHCQCGVSRSATMVIALVMRAAEEDMNAPDEVRQLRGRGMQAAYDYVKSKSKWVGPNMSLIYQLLDYERVLRGGSPMTQSAGASDDEEWERQRRQFDLESSSEQENPEIQREAKELDREMEERRARKLSLASANSSTTSSFVGAVGNGAPWRSKLGFGAMRRARAASVESNVTSRSSISVLSEDPVEEEAEENEDVQVVSMRTPNTEDTDEDTHQFGITVASPKIPNQRFNRSLVPPSAPATKTGFGFIPVPPSAPASKLNFGSLKPPTPIANQSKVKEVKEKKRPPPLKGLASIPRMPVVVVPVEQTAPSQSSGSEASSATSSVKKSRRSILKPPSLIPFPSMGSTGSSIVSATPSASQTLFVFPSSPTGGSSTFTLTSTPLPTAGFGNLVTPRAAVFRQRTDKRRSWISLCPPTPTTATVRVDAKGSFGPSTLASEL